VNIYVTFVIILLSYLYCIGLLSSHLITVIFLMLTDNKMDQRLTSFCCLHMLVNGGRVRLSYSYVLCSWWCCILLLTVLQHLGVAWHVMSDRDPKVFSQWMPSLVFQQAGKAGEVTGTLILSSCCTDKVYSQKWFAVTSR